MYLNNADYASKVTIAKVDATANDVPDEIQGFPTIKLFRAGQKGDPLTYSGSRSVEDLAEFIKENGSHKIDVYAAGGAASVVSEAAKKATPAVEEMQHQAPAATESAKSAASVASDAAETGATVASGAARAAASVASKIIDAATGNEADEPDVHDEL